MTEAKPQRGARIFDQALTRLGDKIVDFRIDSLDSQPQERKQGIFSGPVAQLAELGLAGTLVFAACNAPATGTPGETSQPSESPTATMTFFPTESPFPTPSPTVEITPSPTPSPTPEATPTMPAIEKVPLVYDGFMGMHLANVSPYYFLEAEGTITAVEPVNTADNTVLFAVTIAGNKISRQCNVVHSNNGDIKLCSYGAITLWIKADQKTVIVANNAILGRGLDLLLPSLKVGDIIPQMSMSVYSDDVTSVSQARANRQSFANLNNSVGKPSLPRANQEFLFYAADIYIR